MATQANLDNAYMKCASAIAELSQAKRKKVGAILVSEHGQIIAEGFNGTPSGFDNNCEIVVFKDENGYEWDETYVKQHIQLDSETWQMLRGTLIKKELKTKQECLHAESNCILKTARSTNSSLNGTLYCTLTPCFECAKLIIQAGIKRVVYGEKYPYEGHTGIHRMLGIELLCSANIVVEYLPLADNPKFPS